MTEWVETRVIDGLDRLTANLRLDEATLTITTNSEPRLDAALATVRARQPSLTLTAEERMPMSDARAAARMAETLPSSAREASEELNSRPEVQAALAEYIRSYEEQWLDLPVPRWPTIHPARRPMTRLAATTSYGCWRPFRRPMTQRR